MTTITVDRAVLEQAMEYLERSVDNYPIGYALSRRSHEAAITALRQALEAAYHHPVSPELEAEINKAIAKPGPKITGDIKGINTILIGRDALQELKQAEPVQAEPVKHHDWCASLTQMLLCNPPKPSPCNCKQTEPVQAGQVTWDASAPFVMTPHPAFAKPQRTWVGLTDEEREQHRNDWHSNIHDKEFRSIEAKLKEKNNG
jgi:hypothetical protein